ncbi:MAG: substrate-binding domain-containing protein [Rhodocyclaceae bacterium]|nr:substrate-binding domain-containing protein [Rhodocyclaceae bacterium]
MKEVFRFSFSRTFLALFISFAGASCIAAELTIAAPNAVKDAVMKAAERFQQSTGDRVVFIWSGTEAITKRVSDGDRFDVVLNTSTSIDKLTAESHLSPGSRVDFANSSIGVAVRAGSPKPDIKTVEGLKAALLSSKSIAISSGTSGRHLTEVFAKLGIADQLKTKIKQPPSGAQIGDLIADGSAEIGFQQVSELVHAKGVDYVGPLPTEIQSVTTYSAGLHAKSAKQDTAKRFMKILADSESAAAITKSGLQAIP